VFLDGVMREESPQLTVVLMHTLEFEFIYNYFLFLSNTGVDTSCTALETGEALNIWDTLSLKTNHCSVFHSHYP
jgi:hypothetical protein